MASLTCLETVPSPLSMHHSPLSERPDPLSSRRFPGLGLRASDGGVGGGAGDGDALAAAAGALKAAGASQFAPAAGSPALADQLRRPGLAAHRLPRLLPLGSQRAGGLGASDWTWLGAVDRFELVKSCKRARRRRRPSEHPADPLVPPADQKKTPTEGVGGSRIQPASPVLASSGPTSLPLRCQRLL